MLKVRDLPQGLVTQTRVKCTFTFSAYKNSGFGDLGVACCLYVPNFAGSNPAEAVRNFRCEKILSMPSFGGEVKPSVPCRRFAACKRSLNVPWKSCI